MHIDNSDTLFIQDSRDEPSIKNNFLQLLTLRVNGSLNGKISGRVKTLQLAATTHSAARFIIPRFCKL